MQTIPGTPRSAVFAFCALLSIPLAPALAQTASTFVRDMIKAGHFIAVERHSDSVVVITGPKFRFIGAPSARAELCQRLLVHERSSSPEVTRVVLRSVAGAVLGSCTASGYQGGG